MTECLVHAFFISRIYLCEYECFSDLWVLTILQVETRLLHIRISMMLVCINQLLSMHNVNIFLVHHLNS